MDIFDAISEATTEANAFTDHAGKALSLEERILYLQGLSLVMNADNDIHAEEKEYLRILIKSFDMDESILDSCLEFANAPDKDTIQDFFRAFRRKPIAQLFLFDAYVMMGRDGESHEKEINVINKIVEQLEILKGTQQDIYDLFCHIKNRNWQESALYFDSFLLDKKYFQHLLAYYEVDYETLMAETEAIRKDRLLKVLAGKSQQELEWKPVRYENEECLLKETSITKHFINMKACLMNAEVIIPYLQARLNRGELRVYQQQVSFTAVAKESEGDFFNLKDTGLSYDEYTDTLSLEAPQTFNVPDNIVESLLVFVLPEFEGASNPKSINIVLQGLFGAKMGMTLKSGSRVKFPMMKEGQYSNKELLMIYKGYFIRGEGKSSVNSWYKQDITLLDVLLHEPFRLMR